MSVEQSLQNTENELDEVLPEGTVARLRSNIHNKIHEALSLGVFKPKDAHNWENGFEACAQIEHMQNLVDIIDDFIKSGLEVVHQLETLINSGNFSKAEQNQLELQVEDAEFSEKRALIVHLHSIIGRIVDLRKQLIKIIGSQKIAPKQQEVLLEQFNDSSAEKKELVVNQAVTIARRTETPLSTSQPKVPTESQPTPQSCENRINQCIATGKFTEARNLLFSVQHLFDFLQFSRLLTKIDQAQIINTRQQLAA